MRIHNVFESALLLAFGMILLLIYFMWLYWSLKTNYKLFLDWQSLNPNLRIVLDPKGKRKVLEQSSRVDSEAEDGDVFVDGPDDTMNDSLITSQPRNLRLRSSTSATPAFLAAFACI